MSVLISLFVCIVCISTSDGVEMSTLLVYFQFFVCLVFFWANTVPPFVRLRCVFCCVSENKLNQVYNE